MSIISFIIIMYDDNDYHNVASSPDSSQLFNVACLKTLLSVQRSKLGGVSRDKAINFNRYAAVCVIVSESGI